MRFTTHAAVATLFLAAGAVRGQDYNPPKVIPPSENAKKQIVAKGERLVQALAFLGKQGVKDNVLVDVEVYLQAAQSIIRHEEFYHQDSPDWTLAVLDQVSVKVLPAPDQTATLLRDKFLALLRNRESKPLFYSILRPR